MSISLVSKLFLTGLDDKITLEYLNKIGISSDRLREGYKITDDYYFEIEVRECPSIINTLKLGGYFEEEKVLNLAKVTEMGITFYLLSRHMGDGFLFVPMTNIISIHTIDKNNLKNLINQCF